MLSGQICTSDANRLGYIVRGLCQLIMMLIIKYHTEPNPKIQEYGYQLSINTKNIIHKDIY